MFRIREDGSWMQIWESNKIDNNQNPVWPVARIPMMNLCNGDVDRPLKVEIWDHESSGRHQFMGCFETSARGLLESGGSPFNVMEGEIIVDACQDDYTST